MVTLIILVLFVLIASAMCSCTEAAIFSVPLVRVRNLAQSKKRSALALLAICESMSRPIAAIVILNNIANIVGSSAIGWISANELGVRWVGYVSGILTFLVIVFAEIIPKTLGERYSEKVALFAAIPVMGVAWFLTPIIWVIEKIISPVTSGNQPPMTNKAEIKLMAKIGHKEGAIQRKEAEIIQKVLDLSHLKAADLMTPRVTVTHLDGNTVLSEAMEDIINSEHSRILVTAGSRDEVTGIVYKDELLAALLKGKKDKTVGSLQHKVRFVPETIRADFLLDIFQKQRQHLAVVIDEYGGLAGVVSLEDVLEILTGEIVDETDRTVDMQEVARMMLRRRSGY